MRHGQAFGGYELSGFGQIVSDTGQIGEVVLNILLRPGLVGIDTLFGSGHQQNVLHIVCSFSRGFLFALL
jgi:hypothetical protein